MKRTLFEAPSAAGTLAGRLVAAVLACAIVAPGLVLAQAADLPGVGADTKKAEKKGSLFDEQQLKKQKEKKKVDPDAVQKGDFDAEKLESLSFDAKARKLQAQKSVIRNKMIKEMESFVERKGGSGVDEPERMASIYFRLAETWWEETHYQYLLARARYNAEVKAFEDGVRKTKPTEPVENYEKSILYYEKVLQQFPSYKRIDEVIYRLGKAALGQGKALGDKVLTNKGVQYLNQLIQKYQQSQYIPQSHLALAEHFFDSNNLTLAKMNYERIVQNFRSSNLFNYALYKLGWVYFNLREFERAVETFQSVVREIDKSKVKQIEFRDQALNDLVPAYAELERGWPAAKEYYTKVEGEKQMWVRLERLAALYVANDKQELAIELHGHFIETKPTDPRCVDWWETIVDIYMTLEKFEDIEVALRKFLAFTDERTSPWVSANKKNAEVTEKAAKLGETYLIYLSNHFHQRAQKIEEEQKSLEAARPDYVKAAADYAEFVRRYPNSKKAYIVNFYYAEILYLQLKDFEKARAQYKRVIELDKEGEYLEDAALGVIYSVEELLKNTRARYDYDKKTWIEDPTAPSLVTVKTSDASSAKVEVTKKSEEETVTEDQIKEASVPKKRQELHPLERDFVDAADKYVTLMENLQKAKGAEWMKKKNRGRDVPGIMYVASATYYERGQYPEAIERLERVYKYDEARVESEIAVKTLIDIYARQKNWQKIEEWARVMLSRKKMQLFKVKDLRKYIAVSVGEQARELAERKDFDGAHAKYDTILTEFRKDEPELAAISLFNKAAIYEIQKEEKKAIQTYERVVKEFKNSKVAPEAMFNIGMIYEAQTQFREAADSFLKMAKIRKNADAAQALINAGQILNALGQHKEAAAAYADFIKTVTGLKETDDETKRLVALVPDAYLEIGRVYERAGMLKDANKSYGLVASKFGARPELQVEAIGRSMKLLIDEDREATKPKNAKKIQDYIKQVLKIWENPEARGGNAQYYFAQSLFHSAEFLFDIFAKLSLKDVKNMKMLKPMLEKQATTLKAAEKSYFEVIDSTAGGQGKYFAACAAYKVGMLYYRFKEDLFSAPLPKQVERAVEAGYPEVEERYRQAIEQVAAPIEEQSLVALRGAIQTAHNLGAYNDCTRQAGEIAAKMNPNEYPTVEKDPNLPRATTALNATKTTDTSSSAAFVTRVRRGKFTVSYKPEDIASQTKEKAAAERK